MFNTLSLEFYDINIYTVKSNNIMHTQQVAISYQWCSQIDLTWEGAWAEKTQVLTTVLRGFKVLV